MKLSLTEQEYYYLKNLYYQRKNKQKNTFEMNCYLHLYEHFLKKNTEMKRYQFMNEFEAEERDKVLNKNINFNILFDIVSDLNDGEEIIIESDRLGYYRYMDENGIHEIQLPMCSIKNIKLKKINKDIMFMYCNPVCSKEYVVVRKVLKDYKFSRKSINKSI